MNNTFLKPLRPEECQGLVLAFNEYLTTLEGKFSRDEKLAEANRLIHQYAKIFRQNPAIRKNIEKSSKSNKEEKFFDLNRNDIANLTTTRLLEDYKNSQYLLSPAKGRLLIFIFELLGFYERPTERPTNILYEAIMAEIYASPTQKHSQHEHPKRSVNEQNSNQLPGRFSTDVMEDLIGTYQVFRKSFNSSFPGFVAVYTLKIFIDEDSAGNKILSYRTRNSYDQSQTADAKAGTTRVRESRGHIFNYQGLLFFLGGITYSHLEMFEGTKTGKFNYPEVMLMHLHGGDKSSIRGVMMSHFPFLGLPVSTSVLMTKLGKNEALKLENLESEKDESLTEESLSVIQRYFGNIDPDMVNERRNDEGERELSESELHLLEVVKRNLPFIENKIETRYSNMLTP